MLPYEKILKIRSVDTNTGRIKFDIFYQVEDKDEEVTRIYENLNIIDRCPKSGDKLYFLKGVTVPRFKIKKLHKDKGSKQVKYIESANLVVISKNTISEFFNNVYYYDITKDNMISYISNWIYLNNEILVEDCKEDETWALELGKELENIDCVLHSYDYAENKYLKDKEINFKYNSHTILSEEQFVKLNKIVDLTCDIIDESSILKELNTNLSMDKSMYESIKVLLDSPDTSNIALAMEMMANCDYNSSGVYLLLLLDEYKGKLYDMKANKKYVNFAAMLNYFDISPSSMFRLDTTTIISKLENKNCFNDLTKNTLKPFIVEEINRYINNAEVFQHCIVSDIVFIDKEDAVGNDELPESDGEILESKTEEEICIELDEIEDMILDPIIYDELSQVIEYCIFNDLVDFTEILVDVRDNQGLVEDLLPIIEHLTDTGADEQSTLLIQCYLSIP